ncbi:MAG: helix-hairpin-helix domain-containing protein [Candidatus Deferrimicrobiaceae bacterium]
MGASGRLLVAPQAPSFGRVVSPSGYAREVAVIASPKGDPRGGHGGPLTVRQRFLLGRRLDINRAGHQEISGLPGISVSVAKAVVDERKRRGGYRRPEDLLAVRGIKEKRLKKILPFIAIIHNN